LGSAWEAWRRIIRRYHLEPVRAKRAPVRVTGRATLANNTGKNKNLERVR
jgi:hypothetical protein